MYWRGGMSITVVDIFKRPLFVIKTRTAKIVELNNVI